MDSFGLRKRQLDAFMRDVTSLGGGFVSFFIVVLLFITGKTNVALQLFIGFFMIYPTAAVIRTFHFRDRPKKETYRNFLEKLDASSFPSIHSANSFYTAYVLHNAFASNPASMFLFLLAIAVGYTRIYLKKHYLSDVIAGAVIGIVLSYITVTYLIL